MTHKEWVGDKVDCDFTARSYRNFELNRADVMIQRLQDGERGIGTQKAWREYRIALRKWPESESFPDVAPEAPDA